MIKGKRAYISLDRTFCEGRNCPRKGKCDRYKDHPAFKEAFKRAGRERMSVSQFGNVWGEHKCDMFSRVEYYETKEES